MEKVYRLYCEICNWRKITDGSFEDLQAMYELKSSPIPGGVPKIDPDKKTIVNRPSQKQQRKFRCPSCGRVVKATKIDNPQAKVDDYWRNVEKQQEEKKWADEDAKFRADYEATKRTFQQDQDRVDAG